MPNPGPVYGPHIAVRIDSAAGAMSNWYMMIGFMDDSEHYDHRLRMFQDGRQTVIKMRQVGGDFTEIVRVAGFVKAMNRLSAHLNRPVRVYTHHHYSLSERGLSMLGIYGSYTPPPPPPPPVVATVHPIEVLREAHAEYHARVRGESTGHRFGYCTTVDGCTNVAAGIVSTDGKFTAACKAHTMIDPDVMNSALDLIRRNGRVFVAEAKSFGIPREAFARLVRDQHAELIKDGPMSRWVPVKVAADAEESATPFHRGNGKHKHLSHRRGRKF